jgi:hypothetical protein
VHSNAESGNTNTTAQHIANAATQSQGAATPKLALRARHGAWLPYWATTTSLSCDTLREELLPVAPYVEKW